MIDPMNIMHTMARAYAPTRPSTRFDAIDSAKGVGIVLVVFGHAWRGAMGGGVISDHRLFGLIDAAVYAFHMPLFFFLSGLLFLEALQKYETGNLLRGRLTRLLWPMALWSWLFFGLKFVAGEAANTPVVWSEFPLIPLPPYEHLWFLWALFLCQSILIFGYRVVPRSVTTDTLRKCAGIGALVLAVLSSFIYLPSLLWGPMVEHIPYFLAGIAAGGFLAVRLPLWIGVVCAAGFAVLLVAVQGEKASVIHSLALVTTGWGVWLCVDRAFADTRWPSSALRYLGQASMTIYLTHTVFSAGMRIALLNFGFDDVGSIVLISMLAGLSMPFLALLVARRLQVTKLMGF